MEKTRRDIICLMKDNIKDKSTVAENYQLQTIKKIEKRLTSLYHQDLFKYQRNTQIVVRQLAEVGCLVLNDGDLDVMTDNPGAWSLGINVKRGDQGPLKKYEDSIREFEELIGTGDSLLECKKCHQHSVVWSQHQTRGGDEGATTFCKCMNTQCLAAWKF